MILNRCKLNPCCGDQTYCYPPPQPDGSYWDGKNWVFPNKKEEDKRKADGR